MNDDGRDSLVEFQSSIFDASDGHQLVNFIRKKKGLRVQPQKIFDDVPTDRQSLQIEIQRLDDKDKTLQPERSKDRIDNEIQSTSSQNSKENVANSPQKPKSSALLDGKLKLKRLSHTIGRRTLLKEFERTLQESRFLPPTCSTPLSAKLIGQPASPEVDKENGLSKTSNATQAKSCNLNNICTPITISDDESPVQTAGNYHSQRNQTATASSNTEIDICEIQRLEALLSELNESESNFNANAGKNNELNLSPSGPNHLPTSPNRTLVPTNREQRLTYTVCRDVTTGNLLVSADEEENATPIMIPKAPIKDLQSTTKKLVVTPKQRKLLLNKFGRHNSKPLSSPQRETLTQKTSRIPIILRVDSVHVPPRNSLTQKAANLTCQIPEISETAQIIEQLQKKTPSNVPVIVIPVNQTFNQAPNEKSTSAPKSPTYRHSPNSNEITSTTTTTVPQLEPVVTPSTNEDVTLPINSLRLEDILTADESSSSDDNQRLVSRQKLEGQPKKSSIERSKQLEKEKYLKLCKKKINSSHKVREIVQPHELLQMREEDILDLRTRNSRGELRNTLYMSERECSMLEKQLELELLRRCIQGTNYEDEVLQMEVLPPPPDEFSDGRQSSKTHKTLQLNTPAADDLIDEKITDKISLSQASSQRFSKSSKGRKPHKKKKRMSEQLEKYLEASKMVSKSKYLNLSKRKLYSKGNSDASTSDDSSPEKSYRRIIKPQNLSKSRRKFHETVPSIISNNDFERIPTSDPNSLPPPTSLNVSPAQPSPSVDNFINKSIENQQTIPKEKEIFKKPLKRPPKKKEKQSKKTSAARKAECNTTRSPLPVDPDEISSNDGIRRSKRERKPLTAYWSCTKKEYCPLYDVYRILGPKKNASTVKSKNTKKPIEGNTLPSDNLVANTKNTKSVDEPQNKKKANKKQQEHEPEKLNKKEKKSKKPTDITSSSSECPSYHSLAGSTSVQPGIRTRRFSSDSTSEHHPDSNSGGKLVSDSHSVSSEYQPDDLPIQPASVREENEEPDENHSSIVADIEKPAKQRNSKRQPSTSVRDPIQLNFVENIEKPTKFLPKKPKSKKKTTLTASQATTTSSDCLSEENASSIQRVRLTTIAEDSVPELNQQVTVNTSELQKENRIRLSSELMPPPAIHVVHKKSKALSKKKKNGAFRTEHDESIADVSAVHVNKLFDQLKSSSMCAATTDVNAQHVSCIGQVSLGSTAKDHSAAAPKCKNLCVRLLRVKNKKTPSEEGNEKVCDSGFSSEDISSNPKESGDILLNWLKQLLKNGKNSKESQKGVARFLQSDGCHFANADNLIFQEVDGVDYAFYDTKEQFSFGYMRFNQRAEKKRCTAKKYELNFIILCGTVRITVNGNASDYKNGDLITVFKGSSYGIKNISNDPALVMVIKK